MLMIKNLSWLKSKEKILEVSSLTVTMMNSFAKD